MGIKDKIKSALNIYFLLSIATFFILGLIFGKMFFAKKHDTGALIHELRGNVFNQGSFKFINPLLGCEVTLENEAVEFADLRNRIEQLIKTKITNKDASNIAVYFDTRDGRWLSVNKDETFFPASLLKVPVMIAFLKTAQTHPEILSKKVIYEGGSDLNNAENFKPEKTLVPNQYYTGEELMERMIIDSDNNALALLGEQINQKDMEQVFSDLGFSVTSSEVRVKQYSRFFRVLYNGTYLNREMSEKAMELLGRANFADGIRAGVLDKNITISQKFGERNLLREDGQSIIKELHDCGIVYYPDRPYLLCVMTRGQDFNKLAKSIQDISQMVNRQIQNGFEIKK